MRRASAQPRRASGARSSSSFFIDSVVLVFGEFAGVFFGEDVKGVCPVGFRLRWHASGEWGKAGRMDLRGGPGFARAFAPALDDVAEAEGEKLRDPRVAERWIW